MLSRLISRILPAVPRTVVHRVARRYVAGETKEEAIVLSQVLQTMGFSTTIDMLGEDAKAIEQSTAAVLGYQGLISSIANAGIERNISIKLTQLGLRCDTSGAFDRLLAVLGAARDYDTFVRIDMEDSSMTDATISAYLRGRQYWPCLGTVLQARLRRTVGDASRLAAAGASVRLCKGIYPEPPDIAYTDPEAIRGSYVDAAEILLNGGAKVAFATHDETLVARLLALSSLKGVPRERVEFQALLGVPIRSMLDRLRHEGFPVRLYVPYGIEWYAYGLRRIRENPDMAGAIVWALLRRDRLDLKLGTALLEQTTLARQRRRTP